MDDLAFIQDAIHKEEYGTALDFLESYKGTQLSPAQRFELSSFIEETIDWLENIEEAFDCHEHAYVLEKRYPDGDISGCLESLHDLYGELAGEYGVLHNASEKLGIIIPELEDMGPKMQHLFSLNL